MSSQLPLILYPSHLNTHFQSQHLTFDQYIAQTEANIARARLDLTPATAAHIIDVNSPYAWAPPKKGHRGVLLIHGLLDSPFSLRDIGQYFLSRGFLVRSILLPGHGTRPGDLLVATADDWVATVNYAIRCLQTEVDDIWLVGLSGGASLAMHYAAYHPAIRGLVLFSPLIHLKTPWTCLAKPLATLGRYYPPIAWCKRVPEIDNCKYESFPFHLVQQAYRLTQLMQSIPTLTCPIWMTYSVDDETINTNSAYHFFAKQPHPQNQLLIYSKYIPASHLINIHYRNSAFPSEQIIDFSHVGLHINPQNPHYGRNGDYPAVVYQPKHPLVSSTSVYLGALSRQNLRDYRLRRLTYNPDYADLLSRLDDFLQIN